MTEKELLTALLSKTLNIDNSDIESIVYDSEGEGIKTDALTLLLEKDAARVAKFKSNNDPEKTKEINDNFYRKGKKEALTELEQSVKSQFGFDSELNGVDLVSALVESRKGEGQTKQLTEDDVKRHPLFQDLKQANTKAVEEVEGKWKAKVEEIETGYQRARTFSTVKNKALTLIKSRKPVLPADERKAQNQLDLIMNQLNGNQFDLQGDRVLVMDATGKVMEDPHGNQISFDQHVNSIADKYLDFAVAEQRSSTGAVPDADKGAEGKQVTAWTGKKPENDAEYMAMIADAASAEDKKAITDAYFA